MEKVAIVGNNLIGATIAADMINCGVVVYLLNISTDNADYQRTYETVFNDRGLSIHDMLLIDLVSFDLLKDVDWIIDFDVENLERNLSFYRKISTCVKKNIVISFNTSTVGLGSICATMPNELVANVVVVHFIYLTYQSSLLEVVIHENNFNGLVEILKKFCLTRIGKEIFLCHDICGLISDRVISFWIMIVIIESLKFDISIEEADKIVANLYMGIVDCGVFHLLDRIGIDRFFKNINEVIKGLPNDDLLRTIYSMLPEVIFQMVHDGNIGVSDCLGGFYRKYDVFCGAVTQVIDLRSGLYRSLKSFSKKDFLSKNVNIIDLCNATDNFGKFCRSVLSQTLEYIEYIVSNYEYSMDDIDKVISSGCNWKYLPSRLSDFLIYYKEDYLDSDLSDKDVNLSVKRKIYKEHNISPLLNNEYKLRRSGVLSDIVFNKKPIIKNDAALLWDMGEKVACFEFNTQYNELTRDSFFLLSEALDIVDKNFKGMVIGNDSVDFSKGILLKRRSYDIPELDNFIKYVQEVLMRVKISQFPVVVAISGLTSGGACDLCLHCDAIQAHVHSIIELVEFDCNVFSGCGAYKEMILRCLTSGKSIREFIDFIAQSKSLKSVRQMNKVNFCRKSDGFSIDRNRLLIDSRDKVLSLSADYSPPKMDYYVKLPGIPYSIDDFYSINSVFIDGLINILNNCNGKSEIDILRMEREMVLNLFTI